MKERNGIKIGDKIIVTSIHPNYKFPQLSCVVGDIVTVCSIDEDPLGCFWVSSGIPGGAWVNGIPVTELNKELI